MFQRLAFQLGFTASLLHLYGQRLGNLDGLSLLHLYEGPLAASRFFVGHEGLLNQLFYMVIVVFLANAALQRLLRRLTQSV